MPFGTYPFRGSWAVRDDASFGELRNDIGAVAHQTNGDVLLLAHRILQDAHRFIEGRDHEVAISGFETLLDALRIDVDA
jgi:hypothetical protein